MDITRLKKWWPVAAVLLLGSIVGALGTILGGAAKVVELVSPTVGPFDNGNKVAVCGGTVSELAVKAENYEELAENGEYVFEKEKPIFDEHGFVDCIQENEGKIIRLQVSINWSFPMIFPYDEASMSRVVDCGDLPNSIVEDIGSQITSYIAASNDVKTYMYGMPRHNCLIWIAVIGGTHNNYAAQNDVTNTFSGFYIVEHQRVARFYDAYILTETDVPFEVRQSF